MCTCVVYVWYTSNARVYSCARVVGSVHDEWRLSTQLQRDLLARASRQPPKQLSDLRRTSEANLGAEEPVEVGKKR